MAVKVVTQQYTFDTTGKATLAQILGRPTNTWIGAFAVRAARGNVSDVYWSDETGEFGGFIGPAEAHIEDFGTEHALINNVILYGLTGDTVYLTVHMDRSYFSGIN